MSIYDYKLTFCVSSRLRRVNEIRRCISADPESESAADQSRDDHRVFWLFESHGGEEFADAMIRGYDWAQTLASYLTPIEDASLTLWCEIYSNTEFAGLAFSASDMKRLGSSGIDLVVSVYAEPPLPSAD